MHLRPLCVRKQMHTGRLASPAAACYAGSTKREPTVVGKPAEFVLTNIAAKFGLRRDQICMVGDRLDTDVLFGQHGGLTTMLVLSGAQDFGRNLASSTNAVLDGCQSSEI